MRNIICALLCMFLTGCYFVDIYEKKQQERREWKEDLPCVQKVSNLRNIINKLSITKADIDYISSVYNDSVYRHYSVRSFNGGIPESMILCNNDKDEFSEEEMSVLKTKITKYCKNNYWDILNKLNAKLCDDYESLKKGCMVNFDGFHVADYGARQNGVIVAPGYLFGTVYGKQSFVYTDKTYYDNEKFETNDYFYSYIGVYDDFVQKLPAFKRTNQKISTYFNEIDKNEWCEHVKNTEN